MNVYNETYTKQDMPAYMSEHLDYHIFFRRLYFLKMGIHSIPKINATTFIWYSKMAIWA